MAAFVGWILVSNVALFLRADYWARQVAANIAKLPQLLRKAAVLQ
jgi:hypothetical protein